MFSISNPPVLDGIGLTVHPIVYFGNQWSSDHRTSSHHIASRLARRCPVLYIETPGLRAPQANRRDFKRLWRLLQVLFRAPQPAGDGIWRMTMPQAPFRRWRIVRFLNERFTVWRVRRALVHLGWKRPILWFTIPHVQSVVGKLDERLSVYYCVDDYSALPNVDVDQLRQMDEDLSKRVELIFAVSRTLEQAKRKLNPNVFYSPHGVEVEHFTKALDRTSPVAGPTLGLRHPVVGFFGVLDGRMDVELLRQLADARPQWTILIVGRVAVDVRQLAQRPNLVFAGPVPYETLPDWARAFDVCIMPYRAGSFAEHCNPLKLREYLATGKPVISSVLGELETFAPHIRQATTAADFVVEIEQALQSNSESDQRERMRAVSDMSWEARVEQITEIIEQRLATKEIASSGVTL